MASSLVSALFNLKDSKFNPQGNDTIIRANFPPEVKSFLNFWKNTQPKVFIERFADKDVYVDMPFCRMVIDVSAEYCGDNIMKYKNGDTHPISTTLISSLEKYKIKYENGCYINGHLTNKYYIGGEIAFSFDNCNISSPVNGQITWHITENEEIKDGQVIATVREQK